MLASANRYNPSMRVRTTAYTNSESDHIVCGVKNASGANLKYGMLLSAAADWSRFPVGTRFCIASEIGGANSMSAATLSSALARSILTAPAQPWRASR